LLRALLALLVLVLAVACASRGAPTPRSPTGPGFREPCERARRCDEGLTCRYVDPASKRQPYCDLETGRCRFDGDCAQGQGCQGPGEGHLGVCSERGL
jgi:hypothetical protein